MIKVHLKSMLYVKIPKDNSYGFTFVEILVAVLILSILAGAAVFIFNPTVTRNRALDAHRFSNLQKLAEGIEAYRTVEEVYPPDTNGDGNPVNDNPDLEVYIPTWPNWSPISTTYQYVYNSATLNFGLRVPKSDGRAYIYRSEFGWGKRVRECPGTVPITNTDPASCP